MEVRVPDGTAAIAAVSVAELKFRLGWIARCAMQLGHQGWIAQIEQHPRTKRLARKRPCGLVPDLRWPNPLGKLEPGSRCSLAYSILGWKALLKHLGLKSPLIASWVGKPCAGIVGWKALPQQNGRGLLQQVLQRPQRA